MIERKDLKQIMERSILKFSSINSPISFKTFIQEIDRSKMAYSAILGTVDCHEKYKNNRNRDIKMYNHFNLNEVITSAKIFSISSSSFREISPMCPILNVLFTREP